MSLHIQPKDSKIKYKKTIYQGTAEKAGARALLFTDNAPTDQTVIDQLMLLAQAITWMATRDQDCKPVLSLFCV